MSEINTTLILDGISLALRSAYPDSQIAADSIEQGLESPAFILQLVSSGQSARGKQRWRRLPRFDILYFPKKGREECYAMADSLCSILDVITLPGGDKVRGSDITFEVTDNVLHFLVSYNYSVYSPTEETPMESIELISGGN